MGGSFDPNQQAERHENGRACETVGETLPSLWVTLQVGPFQHHDALRFNLIWIITSKEGKDIRSYGGGLDLEFETLKCSWVSKYWCSFALGIWGRRRWCHGRAGRGECVAFSFGISPQPGARVVPRVWRKCGCHLRAWFWPCYFGGAAV